MVFRRYRYLYDSCLCFLKRGSAVFHRAPAQKLVCFVRSQAHYVSYCFLLFLIRQLAEFLACFLLPVFYHLVCVYCCHLLMCLFGYYFAKIYFFVHLANFFHLFFIFCYFLILFDFYQSKHLLVKSSRLCCRHRIYCLLLNLKLPYSWQWNYDLMRVKSIQVLYFLNSLFLNIPTLFIFQ